MSLKSRLFTRCRAPVAADVIENKINGLWGEIAKEGKTRRIESDDLRPI
jgi:hypothetical protein